MRTLSGIGHIKCIIDVYIVKASKVNYGKTVMYFHCHIVVYIFFHHSNALTNFPWCELMFLQRLDVMNELWIIGPMNFGLISFLYILAGMSHIVYISHHTL